MSLFKYQAKNKEGQIYERTVEAESRLDIYNVIRQEGGTVVSIKEKKQASRALSFSGMFGGIKTQEKINFAKSLAAMINAGLSVTRALAVMGKQTRKKSLKKLLTDIEADVSHGNTLSEALDRRSNTFSPLFVSMVKAGEESGSVSKSLSVVAAEMEKSYLLVKKVRGAMIYPAVIITVMLIIAILLLIFMVPTLTATFSGIGVKLPLPTRILITLSDFLIHNIVLVLAGLLLLGVGVVMFYRSKKGRNIFDIVSLKIPVVGELVREVQVARTARTLYSLLSAGVEIVVALDITSKVLQNHLYRDVLAQAHASIQKGEPLSAVFSKHENLYPVFVSEMSSVGEETGKIADMLMGVADYYEEQVDQKTKDLSTIIEPVLMIIIGLGVGVFAISMLAPTYSLVDYI